MSASIAGLAGSHTEAVIAAPLSSPNSFGHGHLIISRVASTTPFKQRHNAAVTMIFGP